MKFVADMNLSPEWIPELAKDGHDAVHWREVGAENAPDATIMSWAASATRAVLTADLGFAAAVAMQRLTLPAVVQLRLGSTDPGEVGPIVRRAIRDHATTLRGGAILTIEPERVRIRRNASNEPPTDKD